MNCVKNTPRKNPSRLYTEFDIFSLFNNKLVRVIPQKIIILMNNVIIPVIRVPMSNCNQEIDVNIETNKYGKKLTDITNISSSLQKPLFLSLLI